MNGWAISGAGGAIGMLQGASEVILPHRRPDKLVCVSSGALIGAMISTGRLSRSREILSGIVDSDIREKRLFRYIRRQVGHLIGVGDPLIGLYSNNPLRGLLWDELIGQTFDIDFTAVAVNARTGAPAYWTIPADTPVTRGNVDMIVSQIISSTAIPGYFPAEKINGEWYVDGGVYTHTPIEPLKQLLPECDHITIISTAGQEREQIDRLKADQDYLPGVIGDLISKVPELDFLKFHERNKLALAQDLIDYYRGHPWEPGTALFDDHLDIVMNPRYKYYPSLIVQPSQPLSPSTRFHYEYTNADMEHGREVARKAVINDV